jgi:hypothetical protein
MKDATETQSDMFGLSPRQSVNDTFVGPEMCAIRKKFYLELIVTFTVSYMGCQENLCVGLQAMWQVA